ncbi:hypothetical protein FOPG_13841 [Fusarium oxysporum f. sp. conglutinans race 2 54008]|uniref:Uncharacterized protein n=1 Tax=Fusarium oxysporum f. sp. conglutinans race 2 54008 TaxID=1089457 RepID=X0IAQ2_FUSOX|nr:hypothetical protein FOPG_13841 [Fusarium oxysporum f. sp. conglutinans race 2 54008]
MDPGDTKPPEKSSNQYTGDVCHILSRSQGHPLIPRTILKKCSKLAALLDKKQIFSKPLYTVDIEDCPFSVGHIIIHYLITDKYQCLKPEGQTEDDRSCSELATAFRAHAAAVDLELPSLQLLASSEMRRLEGESEFSLDNADIEQHRTTTRSVSDNYGKLCIVCHKVISISPKEMQRRNDEAAWCSRECCYGVVEMLPSVQRHCVHSRPRQRDCLGDEKAIDTSQLAQEECELLTILQTFDKESSQIYQSNFETGVREKMARETLARAILETWEAGGGSL